MQFEYYIPRYDWNKKQMIMWNIFNNIHVQEWSEKAIVKYLRSPSKYECVRHGDKTYGFEALCEELRGIFMNQLWSRREYEVSISDAFVYEIKDVVDDLDKYTSLEDLKEELLKISTRNPELEKWDCFMMLENNIPIIAHEMIRQWRVYKKENK